MSAGTVDFGSAALNVTVFGVIENCAAGGGGGGAGVEEPPPPPPHAARAPAAIRPTGLKRRIMSSPYAWGTSAEIVVGRVVSAARTYIADGARTRQTLVKHALQDQG